MPTVNDLPDDPEAFFARFEAAWADGDVDGVLACMTEDCAYHNIPMDPLEGHEAIRGFVEGFLASGTVTFETRHQIVGDGIVMNERVDTIAMPDNTVPLRVMGTFVFRDGLIAEWRDYFDMAEFAG